MDMTVGVKYSEDYTDPKADVWDYTRSGGMLPTGANYQWPRTFYEFLVKLQEEGDHDQAFAYKTPAMQPTTRSACPPTARWQSG